MLPILQLTETSTTLAFLLSPIMEIFYFGVFTGLLFMYVKDNAPNRMDVFIGKRIGNILRIHSHKQPSDKVKDMTYKGGMFYMDNADIKLEIKHGIFVRPAFIFDEDNATPIKTTKLNVAEETKTETVTNKNGQTIEVTKKTKSKNYPLDLDLETQWNISARKLYNWWKDKMMETTWRAIIGKTIGSDLGQTIMFLLIGITIGALGLYAIEPVHVIGITQTTTSTTTSITSSIFHSP